MSEEQTTATTANMHENERSVSSTSKSDMSRDKPPNLSDAGQKHDNGRSVSSTSSNLSFKSDTSRDKPPNLSESGQRHDNGRSVSSTSSNLSFKSDMSRDKPPNLSDAGQSTRLAVTNTTSEGSVQNANDDLVTNLKKKILNYKDEQSRKETELKIMTDKNKEDEEKLVQNYGEIFGPSKKEKLRTVLMKGVPGIGKTFQTRKFMIDWANEKSNKDIDLMVSFKFSDLNSRGDKDQSMEDLLNDFFKDFKLKVSAYNKYKVAFVLDGLEECKLHLDFEKNKNLTDIKERASMDVLLTNLIKGNLLPSARLWIISQPSGVDKIPPQYIHRVIECQETLKRRQELISRLKKRLVRENTQVEDLSHPNQENTEHIIRKHNVGEGSEEKDGTTVNKSVTKVKSISEIFKIEKEKTVKTVLTIGEADVGKTFHVKKFVKEWAENKDKRSFISWVWDHSKSLAGQVMSWLGNRKKEDVDNDEELLFPLNASQLNSLKTREMSLVELLNHLLKETKECVISNYAHFKVLFVLDGLDAVELPLDFEKNDNLLDDTQRASVDVLLTNLIKGNLLPTAKLWITSRPSSSKRLPDDSIDRKTEIRERPDVTSQRGVKSQLKEQFTFVSEGIDKEKTSAVLNEIYTDLYIIEGERGEVNAQHESRQVQDAKFKPAIEEKPIKYHDIFKSDEHKHIRIVLTTGVAGIGKTFASMKYMLDWAEGTANENIFYTFPLPFRELNLRKDGEHSLEELIHQFFPTMKTSEINNYDKHQILFVLDGLDECRLDLDFSESESKDLRDVREKTSVNVLLANVIKGNLLPQAQIWITSRPAASNKLPADKVDRVTEVRGFNDEQKEKYFRKRFSDEDLAEKVLSHVKKSRSIYIMCHIPVFCWITSKVLEDFVKRTEEKEAIPKTLTDMYVRFLLTQCRQGNVKYGEEETAERSEKDSCWNESNKDTVVSLGKLAFEELEKGNLLFTEENLKEHNINIENAAVFSGLFTQVKREGCGLYPQTFFSFVHMSIQEFLAAFYVTHTFNDKGENLLSKSDSVAADDPASNLYKTAVDKALNSKTGDWDLFLRFLLGLSLESNQNLLQELLKKTENNNETNKKTIEYIKEKINKINDADKNLSLLHCLNELNDHSLVEEVEKCLKSETKEFEHFTHSQWSALTFVLLMSDEKFDVFDLKKYLKSEKVLLGMLPVVKVAQTASLSCCELSEESCKGLTSSVLSSASSNLTVMDLSNNDLLDSGVKHLADGLRSIHCKLEILNLSGCQVTEEGCCKLASVLKSNSASHLKQLNLSYNHPGDKGKKMLLEISEDPIMKLKTLRLDHDGEHRLKPGLMKYGVDLKFDENTASKRLVLSEGNKKVKTVGKVEEKPDRPANDNRFKRSQVFCDEGLSGICYWEVECRGTVGIAVSYEDVGREWDSSGGLGCNETSWSLVCSKTGYTARHGNTSKFIQLLDPPCQKIGVFLDWEGGFLNYYSVTSEKRSLIHTVEAEFTKPLFPAFWFQKGSVTLCEMDKTPLWW